MWLYNKNKMQASKVCCWIRKVERVGKPNSFLFGTVLFSWVSDQHDDDDADDADDDDLLYFKVIICLACTYKDIYFIFLPINEKTIS